MSEKTVTVKKTKEVKIKREPVDDEADKENIENYIPKSKNDKTPLSKRRKKQVKIEYEEEKKEVKFKKPRNLKTEDLHSELLEPEMIRQIHSRLVGFHGQPKIRNEGNSRNACGRKEGILDACIAVILSQNTSNTNSSRASASLRKAFPDLDDMRNAQVSEIEAAIKSGGLSKVKSERIHSLLQSVYRDYGKTSLEHLRNVPTDEIKSVLSSYKGLGPKTISCVLLFTLGRSDFPVDTHVHRVSHRIGWTPSKFSREKTYEFLNNKIPDDIKYDMHVLMVRHGRSVCQSQTPKCANCPISDICAFPNKTKLVMKTEVIKEEEKLLNDE